MRAGICYVAEIGAYKVKVIYHFMLMQSVPGSGDEGEATDDKRICPNGYTWKISYLRIIRGQNTFSNPNPVEALHAE